MKKLIELFTIQSNARDERRMRSYVCKQLQRMGLAYSVDAHGNIITHKGAGVRPFVVCHIDTVHDFVKHFEIKLQTNKRGTFLYGWDSANVQQVGCGGDDKAGIYACLHALNKLDNVSAVFFSREEVGCVGSKNIALDVFRDASMILQADRKGAADFINYSNGVELYGDDFKRVALPIADLYGYKEARGLCTDAGELCARHVGVACVNLSAGYYNAHTDNEIQCVEELESVCALIVDLCRAIGGSAHSFTPSPMFLPSYSRQSYWDWDMDIWDAPHTDRRAQLPTSTPCALCYSVVGANAPIFNVCQSCYDDNVTFGTFSHLEFMRLCQEV
jgi:hypothetical protein